MTAGARGFAFALWQMLWHSPNGRRLGGLLGLVVIVGGVIGLLYAAGLLGSQGGGTTDTGVKIENARLIETQPPPGVSEFTVGPTVGRFAPNFEASHMDSGARVKLSDFRGRPVYLNWFASWCVPCRAEIPDIDKLQKRHPDLIVIGINREEPLSRARSFLESIGLDDGARGFQYRVPLMDPDGTLYRAYRGLGMPVSIFLNAEGRVVRVYNGQLTLEQMETFYAEASQRTS
ncbi:MAG TPA: TlpA disulfide reductase family protein [Dehalococcoidia bacterium]|nr:TlpA disulfide reductase family protein [Dehalococcoidia bacterium]